MEKKDEKNQVGQPSDSAAAHNVPDPQDAKPPTSPQTPPPVARIPEDQTLQPITPANHEQVSYSSAGDRNIMKRGMNHPGCWVQGGTVEPFASVAWALSDLAELRGVATNPNTHEVDKIRAARVGKERKIWIHPTDPLDIEGTEITRTKQGKIRINLFNFLAREKLLIAVRRRERFALEMVTDSKSPFGPALCLDFSKPLETKVIPPRKKKSEQSQSGGKKKKGPELKTPPPDTDADDIEDEEE